MLVFKLFAIVKTTVCNSKKSRFLNEEEAKGLLGSTLGEMK